MGILYRGSDDARGQPELDAAVRPPSGATLYRPRRQGPIARIRRAAIRRSLRAAGSLAAAEDNNLTKEHNE